MDDIELFLRHVLPWDGDDLQTYKSIHTNFLTPEGKKQVFGRAHQDIGEIIKMVLSYRGKGQDVWAAMGTQRMADEIKNKQFANQTWKNPHRKQHNIVNLKTLFLDVDAVDKNYPTTEAALIAIAKFCADAGLPPPTFTVQSGSGGLHVYWCFDIAIDRARWQPLANALAEATVRHGLMCDRGVTVDSARILRVPNTFNFKHDPPRPVVMSATTYMYTYEHLLQALTPYLNARKTAPDPTVKLSPFAQRFVEGIAPAHTQQVDLGDVADAGCGLFADAMDNHGKGHGQGLWHLLILAATWDIDPRAMAHTMSSGYVKYDPQEVDDMLARKQRERVDRNIGWPTCGAFSVENPGCRNCPHFGDGSKSPFHILLKPANPTQPSVDLPGGYWRGGDDGFIYTKFTPPKGSPWDRVVIRHEMWDAKLDPATGDFICSVRVGGEVGYLHIPRASLSSRDAFVAALHKANIFPKVAWEQPEAKEFVMAWMSKLQDIKQARIQPMTVGWDDKRTSFTYDKRTFDAVGERPALVIDDSVLRYYKPTGDAKPWRDADRLVNSMNQPALDVIRASAFAGPLVVFTGMPGLLLSAFSQESGVGKTTAMRLAQATWGDPVRGMNTLDDTPNSIMKRLGDVQHLPIYWDELKMRQEIENFVKLLFRLTQGRDKARLDRNANAREVVSFATMMTAASNESISEGMGRQTSTTTAGANRVFEIIVPPHGATQLPIQQVSMAIARMEHNYGHAGLAYAAWLGANAPVAAQLVDTMQRELETQVNGTKEERFWIASIAVLLVGAAVANALELTTFDLARMEAFLLASLAKQRRMREDTTMMANTAVNVDDILGQYVATLLAHNILITDRIHIGLPGRPAVAVTFRGDATQLREIVAQYAEKDELLRVSSGHISNWLAEKGYSPSNFLETLKKTHGAMKRNVTIGGGVDLPRLNLQAKFKGWCWDIKLANLTTGASPGSST